MDQTGASNPNGAYWLLLDRLNSTRDVLDGTGALVDALAYDGFGKIKAGEIDSTYRGGYAWTGREIDVETDLQWNHARWYDAKIGKWISQDPLGLDAGDSNLYRYVNNRVESVRDPSGLVGIFYGGAGETAKGDEIIPRLAREFKGPGKGVFIEVPSPVNIGISKTVVNKLVDEGIKAIGDVPKEEQIFIFGFSRGAVLAAALAQRIETTSKRDIQFLGLIDPVDKGFAPGALKLYNQEPELNIPPVPAKIKGAWIARCDPVPPKGDVLHQPKINGNGATVQGFPRSDTDTSSIQFHQRLGSSIAVLTMLRDLAEKAGASFKAK